ncbi:hypothetical protein [Paenibacillus lautus]|uniref:hypothetical protein n=1 Tax=Paenibacillus lautus TaxID=1401 RepID=UPI0013E37214|nr:hypothetical protein [Paenibacillus lautus]
MIQSLSSRHGYFLGQTLKELMCDESTGVKLRNTSVTTIAWTASHGRRRMDVFAL